MKFSRWMAVVFAATLLVALPASSAPGGCMYECRRGQDASGQEFAHCVEYFFGSWYLSECKELTLCWSGWVYDDATGQWRLVRQCDAPDCVGNRCFMI